MDAEVWTEIRAGIRVMGQARTHGEAEIRLRPATVHAYGLYKSVFFLPRSNIDRRPWHFLPAELINLLPWQAGIMRELP